MWVQIIPKKLLKKRLVVYAPVYVAHFPGEPYLFLTKKDASETMLKVFLFFFKCLQSISVFCITLNLYSLKVFVRGSWIQWL